MREFSTVGWAGRRSGKITRNATWPSYEGNGSNSIWPGMAIELSCPETFIEPEAETNLRLFSFSVDSAGSVRVQWAGGIIAKWIGPGWKASSKTCMLDTLHAGHPAGKTMLQDPAGVDVLIVAHSSLGPHESKLIEWLKAFAGRR